jgi:hypothetical protein
MCLILRRGWGDDKSKKRNERNFEKPIGIVTEGKCGE